MAVLTRRTFLLGGFTLFPYLYLERLSIAVRRYRATIQTLPRSFEGFTILHISDLHDKEFRDDELIKSISRERFDMVALTGDLVQGEAPSLTPALELIAAIRKMTNCPIFSVAGNHDWRLKRGEEFNGRLREVGVRVLTNSSAAIERGKERLWLLGVDDPVTQRDKLEQAMDGVDKEYPRLLLSHSPHPYPEAARNGLDLMLCGHTHGGQFRLPFIGACFVPAMGYFPRFDYGSYKTGQTTLIISGGLGESVIPIRINIRPEFSLVTLVRSQGAQADWQASRG